MKNPSLAVLLQSLGLAQKDQLAIVALSA